MLRRTNECYVGLLLDQHLGLDVIQNTHTSNYDAMLRVILNPIKPVQSCILVL